MSETKKDELLFKLYKAQVGMPKNYGYINHIRAMLPLEHISKDRANELRMTWNRRRFNENDINLLIKVCENFKKSL